MVVDTFTALPAFRPLLIFSSLLVLKMGAVAFATANARRKAQVVVNPEDIGVNPGAHAEAQEAATTARTKRAHMNDVENIPGFLALATIFTPLAAATCSAGTTPCSASTSSTRLRRSSARSGKRRGL